jgi:phytoene/squalene synthetase
MLHTNTPSDRVSVAQDALAAFGLTLMNGRQARRERRLARAMARAERRADRAARLALRGLHVAQPPRA